MLPIYLSSVALGLLAPSFAVAQSSNWTIGQTVQTSSGPVEGHPARNASEVSEYLGIPFAQAPVGELRWAAPVKFNGNATLNGTSYGFACPTKPGGFNVSNLALANITFAGEEVLTLLSSNVTQSEDCLNLNVWTQPQTGDAKKAVLVWIYGGGFSTGANSAPGYTGANMATQEDVVVVSINYRLNILGFAGTSVSPANLGFLDQRLALEWVRDNIAAFGGDPDRITIFGQSAGGASVDYYSYSYPTDPIVAGFISESGTAFSWGLPIVNETAHAIWFNSTASLNCGDASSNATEVLECMRKVDLAKVLNAIPDSSGTASILGSFGPTVDDVVVFSNYSALTPAARPMLVGNNDYEAGYFKVDLALDGILYSDTFWDYFNLQEFTCPAGVRANASLAAKNPTWRYRYFGDFPNLRIATGAGAWHAAELAILFDTAPVDPAWTEEEISIGQYMRGAWAAFAKDPVNGLTTYQDGWPQYDPSKETLIRIAYNNVTGNNLAYPVQYDGDCDLINITNTDPNAYTSLPPLPSVTVPTAGPTGTGTTATGTGSATTTARPSETSSSAAGRVGFGAECVAVAALGILGISLL